MLAYPQKSPLSLNLFHGAPQNFLQKQVERGEQQSRWTLWSVFKETRSRRMRDCRRWMPRRVAVAVQPAVAIATLHHRGLSGVSCWETNKQKKTQEAKSCSSSLSFFLSALLQLGLQPTIIFVGD